MDCDVCAPGFSGEMCDIEAEEPPEAESAEKEEAPTALTLPPAKCLDPKTCKSCRPGMSHTTAKLNGQLTVIGAGDDMVSGSYATMPCRRYFKDVHSFFVLLCDDGVLEAITHMCKSGHMHLMDDVMPTPEQLSKLHPKLGPPKPPASEATKRVRASASDVGFGWCRGPNHSERVNGRVKDSMSQEECAAACDVLPDCSGYSHSAATFVLAPLRCYLYGPGLERGLIAYEGGGEGLTNWHGYPKPNEVIGTSNGYVNVVCRRRTPAKCACAGLKNRDGKGHTCHTWGPYSNLGWLHGRPWCYADVTLCADAKAHASHMLPGHGMSGDACTQSSQSAKKSIRHAGGTHIKTNAPHVVTTRSPKADVSTSAQPSPHGAAEIAPPSPPPPPPPPPVLPSAAQAV